MGTSGRPSISKRQKEQARLEKQRDKAARRQQRKIDKQNGVTSPTEETEAGAEPVVAAAGEEPAA